MDKEIMVVKKKRGNERIVIKVKNKKTNSYSPSTYQKVLDVKSSADIAILMSDLELLFDAPIDKAYRKHKKEKNPFWG